MEPRPLLYSELAGWWPLLSTPSDYEEEAALYTQTLRLTSKTRIRDVLELGAGGGNTASHLKRKFRMTLTDLSPGMLAVSEELNPECEHHVGDMRTIRLERQFDAVFVHDAIMYMTTEDDLAATLETASMHLHPGGIVLIVPDFTRESFREATSAGGHDLGSRGLRYLQWLWDPDPTDTTCCAEFAYLLHDNEQTRCLADRHTFGIFARSHWLRTLSRSGFEGRIVPFQLSDCEDREMFVGIKST